MARPRLAETLGWNGIAVATASIGTLAVFLALIRGGFFALLVAFPPVPILATLTGVAGIVLLATRKAWAALAAGILACLFGVLAVTSPGYPGALANPAIGGGQLINAVFDLWAAPVGLVSGILAFRHLRGKPEGRGSERWVAVAAALLFISVGADAMAAVAQSAPRVEGTIVGTTPDATVNLVAKGDQFSTSAASVKAGGLVKIVVDNQDGALHSFTTTAAPATDVDVAPSSVTTIVTKAPAAAGTWEFVCKYHDGMKGKLTVTA